MNQYTPVSVDKHIVPFDVPVHNLLVVKIFQTLHDEKIINVLKHQDIKTSNICLV